MSALPNPICYICQKEITSENDTREHIIPDSIGGKLKGKGILCLSCNNGAASDIDREIASMLSYFYELVRAAQETPPSDLVLTGRDINGNLFTFYGQDLVPQATVTLKIGQKEFIFRDQEAKVLKGVKNRISQFSAKHNNLKAFDLTKDLKLVPTPHPVLYFTDSTGKTRSGGLPFFRSALKTAVNYYLKEGGDTKEIEIAKRLVRDGGENVLWKARFYYPELLPHIVATDEVSHLLHLIGDPKTGILICYIEMFNCHNVLILLSDNYKGKPMEATYCYDLVKKQVIEKKPVLGFNFRSSVIQYFDDNIDSKQKRQEKFDQTESKVFGMLMKKGFTVGSVGKRPTD